MAKNEIMEFVYHYTSHKVALNHILPEGKLRLSPLLKTNDPRESKNWNFSLCSKTADKIKGLHSIHIDANKMIKNSFKVLCLTQDNTNKTEFLRDDIFQSGFTHPRMWAQYAEGHTGVCIIFDKNLLEKTIEAELGSKSPLFHGPVKYVDFPDDSANAFQLDYDQIVEKGLDKAIESHINNYYPTLFFVKNSDWLSECEYRWVVKSSENEFEFVSIGDSILGIILGMDFPQNKISRIKNYCKNYKISASKLEWWNIKPLITPVFVYSESSARPCRHRLTTG